MDDLGEGPPGAESSSSDAAALTALVEGGGVLSPAIKAVLDRDLAPSYEGVIRSHIRHKDTMIARLCSAHYEEFIGSIDSLATLKADIRLLDQHVRDVNDDVQDSGRQLIAAAQRLIDWRRASKAMARTRDLLLVCSRAADAVARAQSASNQGQLMNALKAVAGAERALQAVLAPGGSALGAALVGRLIPAAVDDIKGRVRADADAWMAAAQAKAAQIGAWAVLNTDRRVRAETAKDAKRNHQRMHQLYFQEDEADRVASTLSSAVSDAVDLDEAAGEGGVPDDDLFERVAFVFEPVYQALHIYESLNIAAEFATYYTEQRSAQITKVLEYTSADPAHLLDSIAPYFARIAGFFIIEDTVQKSGNALMPRVMTASLRDVAISSIKVALNDDLIGQMSAAQILDLKHQVVLFSRTMSQFGLSFAPLVSYMASHRDKYEEVLVAAFRADLDAIFDAEKYEPMTVTDAVQYRKVVLAFGLEPADQVDKPKEFPLSVPFSGTVPKIAKAVKHLIADYFSFAASLPDMFAPIRRCVDDVLISLVNARLNLILDGDQGSLNVSQAVQIAVNADALVILCVYWERLIMVYLDPKYYVQPCSLTAKVALSDTRTRGEDSIFEVIERKINEMLDLLAGSIVWCPQMVQSGPCDTVQMLVSFLETTMTCTQYMPASVRTTVHFASCRSITRILVQYVADADAVNVLAMYNLEQDVRHLEGYAAKTAIPNLHEAFAQIRQLLLLFLIHNPEQLLDDVTRQTRFPLIAPHKMAAFLDKFKETAFLSLVPPELPRHSKKVVESVAKKLRNLSH